MPLHDDTPPQKVAAALPLAFIAIHLLFTGLRYRSANVIALAQEATHVRIGNLDW